MGKIKLRDDHYPCKVCGAPSGMLCAYPDWCAEGKTDTY